MILFEAEEISTTRTSYGKKLNGKTFFE